jgi:hypothetical protein
MNSQYVISDKVIPTEKWSVKPGEIYGRLTVIDKPFWAKNPNWKVNEKGLICNAQYVRVRCTCGTEKDVRCTRIIDGSTKSCGKSCKLLPENTGLKKCTKCKNYLDKTAFGNNKSKKDGLATECLKCKVIHYLNTEYKMTLDEYNQKLEKQNGLCAICNEPDQFNKDERWQPLRVDHDHDSGKIRGLLCHSCNVALGLFRDNIENLMNAIAYLEKHENP